jgi:hypothetical protein
VPDPDRKFKFDLKLPLDFLKRVNYRGVVGNQITLGIVALVVFAVIAVCSWGKIEAVYVLVPAVIFIVGIVLYSVQQTLNKHPAAVLEGSQYLEYHRIEMASKGTPLPALTPPIPDPANLTIELPKELPPPEEEG